MTCEQNSATQDDDLTRVISDAISAIEPTFDSGVAVAVVNKNKIVYARGFGYRDRTSLLKVTPKTIFQIGSNTKAFTSMLLSMLAEQGEIVLTDSVRKYMPDFRMKEQTASENLTLAQILSQQTGLPRHDALWYLGPFTRAQLAYRAAYLDPIAGAYGKAFKYNNIMYSVAGCVAECRLGETWEALVQDRILNAVGMPETTFTVGDLLSARDFAKPYELDRELRVKDFSNIAAAGEINSNVVDMAYWVLLLLNKGKNRDGKQIIGEKQLETMYADYTNVSPGLSYGLGWYVTQIEGKRFVFHPGDPDGYSSHVSFLPDDGLGIVVLTNQQVTTNLIGIWPDQIATRIYDFLLQQAVTAKIALPATLVRKAPFDVVSQAASARIADLKDAKNLDEFTGIYSNDGYGDIVVIARGGTLYVDYFDNEWPVVQGSPMSFDVFAFGADFTVPIWFSGVSDQGKFNQLSLPCMPPDPQASLIVFTRRPLNA